MSAELIAIIVMGFSVAGLMLVSLHRMEGRINKRIDGVEQRIDGVEQHIDRVEQRIDRVEQRIDGIDRRIDSIDGRLRAVEQGQAEIKSILLEHTSRLESLDSRIDSLDTRLRAVDRGQSEILGSVNTMNQVVLATLQRQIEGEPVAVE